MNQRKYTEKVEVVISRIRKSLGITADNASIPVKKLRYSEKESIRKIIKDSKLCKRKVCLILGVEYSFFYM